MHPVARIICLAGLLATLGTAVAGQSALAATAPAQRGVPHHSRTNDLATGTQPATSSSPLVSGGGPVITSPAVYLSFWGSEWSTGFTTGGYSSSTAVAYLEKFFAAAGGSGWAGVTTQYCQGVASGSTSCPGTATFVTNPPSQYLGAWVDPYPVPVSPTDADIQAAAVRAQGHFGYRSGAVYFVMTPTGKSETGFGTSWCAWHGGLTNNGVSIPYAYLPYMPDAGSACGIDSVNSNDSAGHGYFDGYSIVGGHEYLEAVTDPFPNSGWIDSAGQENADKCQWGGRQTNYTFPNGSYYAVQPTWSNAIGGCQLAAGPAPAPIPTPAPTPVPAPAPGGYRGYFNWYDNATSGVRNDNIHVVNPGGSAVTGSIQLGATSLPFSIGPGGEGFYAMPPGSAGGPVVVASTARVIATQRVQFNASFNETPARTTADAAADMWFTWYDTASSGMLSDSIVIANPAASGTSGTVTVGPASAPIASGRFSVPAGGAAVVAFGAGVIGGPVHVHSDGGPVLASQRVQYGPTFNEVLGQSSSTAGSSLYFNWFDKASLGMLNDNVHITNPTATTVSGSVRLTTSNLTVPFTAPPFGATYVTFPGGTIGGPLVVSASGSVIASQRVQYYDSFNEVAAMGAHDASTNAWMPWYDRASPGMANDNVHLLNPFAFPISGTVSIAGQISVPFTAPANGETFVNLGDRIGGPVQIAVAGSAGVLASQRVQYYQTFNEAAASS